MMNDCKNVEMREALPELVHGALPEPRMLLVQEHLNGCGDCAAELAIVRAVLATATAGAGAPRVDVAKIVMAIPPYKRNSRRTVTYLQLAAAALIGAAGISTAVLRSDHGARPGIVPTTASATQTNGGTVATRSPADGLALVATIDVSDANLVQLIKDMDNIEALPPADPEPVTPAALDGMGGAS